MMSFKNIMPFIYLSHMQKRFHLIEQTHHKFYKIEGEVVKESMRHATVERFKFVLFM